MANPQHSPRSTGLKGPVGINQDLILGLAIAVFGLTLIFWVIPTQVNDKGSFGLPPSLAPPGTGLANGGDGHNTGGAELEIA